MRVARAVGAMAVLAVVLPQAASGSVARVLGAGDPSIPPSELRWDYVASPGEANDLTITVSGNSVRLHDRVAITPRDGCSAIDPQTVTCSVARGKAKLFDGNDRARALGGSTVDVNGGNGNDVLIGGTGGDYLNGSNGDDTIVGGGGDDVLTGFAGNDTIDAADGHFDSVTCGVGTDRVVLDRIDSFKACEKRRLKGHPAAALTNVLGDGRVAAEADSDSGSGPLTAAMTAKCAVVTRKCSASGQLVYNGNAIASSKHVAGEHGVDSFSFTFTREQVGSPSSTTDIAVFLPVVVRLTVKQGRRTEHSSWSLTMAVPAQV
ncbi:MAG: hypothetical protein ACJ77M_02305 [Thermoleophilaceae bacterium]